MRAIAWHLRVGGPWRALPPWRTVYGWFRHWLDLGLFDRLMREVAVLRRRAAGRRATPTLAIIDTQTVKCIAVRGPRGYDPAKVTVRRKRVVLVDADGVWLAVNTVAASVQERDTLPARDVGSTHWPSLRLAIFDGGFVADRCCEWANFHDMRCHGAGSLNAALLSWHTGVVCSATAPDGWMSRLGVWLSSPVSPVFRRCSIQCQFVPLDYENLT